MYGGDRFYDFVLGIHVIYMRRQIMRNIAMFTYYYLDNKYKQTLSSFFLATDFHKVGCYTTIMYLIKAYFFQNFKDNSF